MGLWTALSMAPSIPRFPVLGPMLQSGASPCRPMENPGRGDFQQAGGYWRQRIARLTSSGTVDTSFDTSSGANDVVYSVALQTDGKVLIGGAFTSFGGTGRARVARLNSNGTPDNGFTVGTGAN